MPDNVNKLDDQSTPLASVVASFREDITNDQQWRVKPTAGDFGVGVDFAAGVLAVPLTGDSYSKRIKLREMIRLRVSPVDESLYDHFGKVYKMSGVSPEVIRVAEQARVNAITSVFADARGLEREPDGSEKTIGKRLATANDQTSWDKAVEFVTLNFGTKSCDSFRSGIRSVNPEWSKQLERLDKTLRASFDEPVNDLMDTAPMAIGDDATMPVGFRHTLQAAGEIASYLSSGYKAPKSIKALNEAAIDKIAQQWGETDERGTMPHGLSPIDIDDMPDDFEFDTDNGEFGALVWDESLKRTVEVDGYMKRKRRAMQYGRRVSYPSRLLTDPERRVFGRKVKVKGGIVVIDISGSMRLNTDDLNAIVEAAPAAVVMAYSDIGSDNPNAWLLADRGWRVKDIGHIGGANNGVDGTALTWAVRKRKYGEDIVWISDGEVTSMGGGQHDELVLQCARLVKKHKIIMIPSVAEAVKMFKNGKLINKPAGPIRQALLGRY